MFKAFLENLKPVSQDERLDWLDICEKEFVPLEEINIMWYASCGIDYRVFMEFTEEITSRRNLPVVDVLICSDYNTRTFDLKTWHEKFDDEDVLPDRYQHVQVSITEMIPLQLFSAEQKHEINNRYQGKYHSSVTDVSIPDGVDFYYCTFELDQQGEYFPTLLTNIENSVLLNEVILRWGIKLKYFCAVTDGCRKGGAWFCMNQVDDQDFFLKMLKSDSKPDYWITDHFSRGHGSKPSFFQKVYSIPGWGNYNQNRASTVYKVNVP